MKRVVVERLCRLGSLLGFFVGATLHAENLTVAWDPSPESGITSYKLYYGEVGGTAASQITTGASTSGSLSGLVPGRTYFLYVTAVDQTGLESAPSGYLTYTPSAGLHLLPVADQSAAANTLLTLTVSATSGTGPLSYRLVSAPDGASLDSASGLFRWTPTNASIGTVNTVTVEVSDSGSPVSTDRESFQVTVTAQNHPPQLAAIADQIVLVQNPLVLQISASDPDGDALTYELISGPDGATLDPVTGLFACVAPATPGDFVVTVRAADSGNPRLTDRKSFNISVVPPNRPPSLVPVPNLMIEAGGTLSWALQATDPDLPGQSLSYRLVAGPIGATVDPKTGFFQWSPAFTAAGTSSSVAVQVSDNGAPALTDTQSFVIFVAAANRAPGLDPIPDQVSRPDSPLTLHLTASDPDGVEQSLSFSLASGPLGATVTSDGVFNWTPSSLQAPSTNVITVQVTDNGSPALSDRQSFVVTVASGNRPPVLAPIPDQQAFPGQIVMLALSATDPDGAANTLRYRLVSGPTGAAVDPNTGIFTWRLLKSAAPSTNVVTVQVSDNGSPALTAAQSFTVTVQAKNASNGTPPGNPGKAAVLIWISRLKESREVRFVYPLDEGKRAGTWVHYLEVSGDLVNWETLGPVSATREAEDLGGVQFSKRFYRIRSEMVPDRTENGSDSATAAR